MILIWLKWIAIAIYTTVFGIPAIFLSFFFPGSDIVPWFGKAWTWFIIKTVGAKVTVDGLDRINQKRTYIYISNHLSNFDVFLLVNLLPAKMRILAKRSLFYVPIFGWSIYLADYISVKREDQSGLLKSFAKVAEKIKKGRPVLFFAEGSRSEDGTLQPFKKGAFLIALKAGVPIVPIAISGSNKIMPPYTSKIHPGNVRVLIGKPIGIENYRIGQVSELMNDTREAIAKNLELLKENR
jgi:1-acyl-sn-glycerol-3-phosphate acyltransferase